MISYDFQCKVYLFTFYNISVADAVVCEQEEVREAPEGSTVAVVSAAAEQATETSSQQGECLKTLVLKKKKRFFFWLIFNHSILFLL